MGEGGADLIGCFTMNAGVPTSTPFRVGDWVVFPPQAEGTARALEDHSWESVELEGQLSGAAMGDARALATLRQLAPLNPPLGRLATVLLTEPHVPLSLGALLRRGGWEMLFLELTGQCNERCVHCYAESSPERLEQLTSAEVAAVVAEAARLGFQTLQLTGGDPLVSKTYLDAARQARDVGIPRVEVYTNGLGLTDRVADALAEVGVDYSFSFFSHRPEVHDGITGTPGSQVRTLAAIRRALAREARVRIGLISTASNRQDVPRTVELLVAQGVEPERIGVDEERGVGRGQYLAAGDLVRRGLPLAPGSPEKAGALDRGTPDTGAPANSAPTALPPARSGTHGSADRGGKLCVSYRAEVYPCIFARNHRLGSVREMTLGQVLDQPLRLRPGAVPVDQATIQGGLTCRECRESSRLLSAGTWGSQTSRSSP